MIVNLVKYMCDFFPEYVNVKFFFFFFFFSSEADKSSITDPFGVFIFLNLLILQMRK